MTTHPYQLAWVLLSSAAICGCGSAGISNLLRNESQACQEGKGDECWRLGETFMRKASMTYWSVWDRPVDAAAARRAYAKGCEASSIRACAALLERHLVDGEPAEKERVLALLREVGVEPRSDAEVEEQDTALKKIMHAEEAYRDKQSSDAWGATLKQLSQLQVSGKPGQMTLVTPEVADAQTQLKNMIQPPLKLTAGASTKVDKTKPGDDKAATGKRPGGAPGIPGAPSPKSGAPGVSGAGAPGVPTAAQLAADEAAKKLAACLAQPATGMRTAQTNPFQSYVTQYQSLLVEAGKCPEAPGSAWKACIGMNARVWPDTEAQRDEGDFIRRFGAVLSFMPPGPSACLYNQTLGTSRSYCVEMGKSGCTQRIEQNIADMQCALNVLPRVWAGEISRNDADAKQRQDDDCRRRFR